MACRSLTPVSCPFAFAPTIPWDVPSLSPSPHLLFPPICQMPPAPPSGAPSSGSTFAQPCPSPLSKLSGSHGQYLNSASIVPPSGSSSPLISYCTSSGVGLDLSIWDSLVLRIMSDLQQELSKCVLNGGCLGGEPKMSFLEQQR